MSCISCGVGYGITESYQADVRGQDGWKSVVLLRCKNFFLLEWAGKDEIDDDPPVSFWPRNLIMSLNKIASAIAEALPRDLSGDVRRNIHAAVQSVLEKMDLVTREELEVQEKVLLRTRQKLEALEVRITELEQDPIPSSD